jgi:hypothetical protein
MPRKMFLREVVDRLVSNGVYRLVLKSGVASFDERAKEEFRTDCLQLTYLMIHVASAQQLASLSFECTTSSLCIMYKTMTCGDATARSGPQLAMMLSQSADSWVLSMPEDLENFELTKMQQAVCFLVWSRLMTECAMFGDETDSR